MTHHESNSTLNAHSHGRTQILIAVPVYNEEQFVEPVLTRISEFADNILVIDDGSSDQTPMLLARQPVEVIRHAENRGYGRSLRDAFRWSMCYDYDWLITMDCDEQHEPAAIPNFLDAIDRDDADVISGSRYLSNTPLDDAPPSDRREINATITQELNERLQLTLTDAFCGYKAYRVASLRQLSLDVNGYEFPMQFWVQAVARGLRIIEIPVRLIYNDPSRTFGGPLDNAESRLQHYRSTLHAEVRRFADDLPRGATAGLDLQPASSMCPCDG